MKFVSEREKKRERRGQKRTRSRRITTLDLTHSTEPNKLKKLGGCVLFVNQS